ncbi:MAG: sigma-54 dependent transcriptional regulator [Bacteroidota bacterium]|nr:sigma-54 dependent transcriptional regulator [Bacteroidota bacterium]
MLTETPSSDTLRKLPPQIVASSDEMRELLGVVRAVAPTLITVLLTGESGTGKEVFARLIHDWSQRASGPFVTVNCGAIPEGLIESELFGHEKGSVTGATAERKGFFETAKGGSIFLDEIGEMPLSAQVKLLRILETGKFTRVGSASERTSDARVIAATNRDLELEVRAGKFRADLYYRLRAVMLRLPPLRNRREDIPFLVDNILRDLVKRHSFPHLPHIESEAIEELTSHEWRGNIRELRNVLEQLSVMAYSPANRSSQGVISVSDVRNILQEHTQAELGYHNVTLTPLTHPQPQQSELGLIYRALVELRSDIAELKERLQPKGNPLALPLGNSEAHPTNGELNLHKHEMELINQALQRFEGDRKRAAKALGISERSLYRKLKELEEQRTSI